jgi:hypothetical protein
MFPVSYRDLELMLLDRGVEVDHTTIFRWIQAYATEFEKRIRPHLRTSNGSWRVDETYVRVKGRWTYLYRAVDSRGRTIDFLLAARRDGCAARYGRGQAVLSQGHGATACRQSAEPSPSTRILPIPERLQICKATVSYRAAPVCGNANTSTPSSSKTTGASSALSGLGSASAVSIPRGKRWRVSRAWR